MSRTHLVLAGAIMLAAAPRLDAQGRAVNLTGTPVATLDEAFSSITGFQEVAPDKVVISDMNEKKLVLADLRANTVKDIGRQGGGPGEWQAAFTVSPGPNGVAYVADPSLRKLHAVDASGKIVSQVPFPGSDAEGNGARLSMVLPRGTDAQGRIYSTGAPFIMGQDEQPDSVPVLRWDPKTKRTDTLGMLKNETKVSASSSGGNTRVMMRVGGGPFAPNTAWVPMRDGRVAVVHPNPYRVDFMEGRTVRRGTPVPYTPIKVTAADKAEYRERARTARPMVFSSGGGSGARPAPAARTGTPEINDADFPATKPPFGGASNAVLVSPEGEVWVLRHRVAGDKVPTYDIFDGAGRLAGKATLKPNSLVVGFGANTVYVSRQDPEDDLLYIEKFNRTPVASDGVQRLGAR